MLARCRQTLPSSKTRTTTACFIGAGNTVDDSEALMTQTKRREWASMRCFTSNVGSGSSSHDFVADASGMFFTSEVQHRFKHIEARTRNCWRVFDWKRRSITAQRSYRFFETSLESGSKCRVWFVCHFWKISSHLFIFAKVRDSVSTTVCKSLCVVGILANTPGGVKRSGLGAHACLVISHVLKLV